jgi:hypothetical protein
MHWVGFCMVERSTIVIGVNEDGVSDYCQIKNGVQSQISPSPIPYEGERVPKDS